MIKIDAMRCGTVGTDETIPDRSRSKNPYAYTGVLRGERHRVWLPVYAYLIEHPNGRILVDTGWHTNVRTDQKKHLSWQLNIASKAILPAGEAVTEQLKARGLSASDIDMVLLTHLDVDHASGLSLVKDARAVYAGRAELDAVRQGDIRYNEKLWEGIDIKPVPMSKNSGFPHHEAWDVFGDGTVFFVNLAGHSAGMTGVMIKNNGKFVILTGDACYNRHSWENRKLPGITADAGKARKSIEWVAKMSKSPDCVEILATHDPEVVPHSIEL